MRRKFLIFLSAFILYAPCAQAVEVISAFIPSASVVGRGTLSYAFWDVYEATLYAPKGQWNPEKPFALSIKYYHDIDGNDIADRSVQEMRRQGFSDEVKLAAWNTQMKKIFPDVKDGTVLSAVYLPGKQTKFYSGSRLIGTIKGDDFGRLFFGIWLNEKTSEPQLRRALLGLS
jgi:hypothetical protein